MKRLLCALLAGAALLGLCGCRSAFERDYYYETPYSGDIGPRSDQATEIRNYSMLKTALTSMITNHTEKGEFRFSSYNGSLSEDLAAACFEIKSDHPLGAYAVESLSYDTSYVVSYYVATIYISYKRTAEELSGIVYSTTAEDFDASVRRAVEDFEPELVIRCFFPDIDELHIRKTVQRFAFDNPVTVPSEPAVEVTSYPAEGTNRIYDVLFRYGLDRQRSADMAEAVTERLEAYAAAQEESEPARQALACARYLSERTAGGSGEGSYVDTAFGALVLENADSRGLALAYRALCDAVGLDCTVVEGAFGSFGTEPHFWNIIALDGDYYHVDVSAMAEDPARAFLLSDDARWGRYIWEPEDYPVCDGPLSYAEAAGIPEEEPEAEPDAGTDAPEGETPPEETDAPAGEEPDVTATPAETGTPEPEESGTPAEPAVTPEDPVGEDPEEGEKTP